MVDKKNTTLVLLFVGVLFFSLSLGTLMLTRKEDVNPGPGPTPSPGPTTPSPTTPSPTTPKP
jgi:hypothetical protein